MSGKSRNPFFSFLMFILVCALIVCAYFTGDYFGYKKGFRETANYTVSRLGIDKEIANQNEYETIIDAYLVQSKSIDKSIENIGEHAGNVFGNIINSLLGK